MSTHQSDTSKRPARTTKSSRREDLDIDGKSTKVDPNGLAQLKICADQSVVVQKLSSLQKRAAPQGTFPATAMAAPVPQRNAKQRTPDPQQQLRSGWQESSDEPVQRLVAQSDWLKIHKGSISASSEPSGPFTKINDTSSKSYRNDAETKLGSLAPFMILQQLKILRQGATADENAFKRAHLIAASFGGQLKFTDPADNIRFHPYTIEYGEWQKAEDRVQNEGNRGYVTARSTESASSTPARIATEILAVLPDDEVTDKERSQMFIELAPFLGAARYVPTSVSFTFSEFEPPGKDIVATPAVDDSFLTVLSSADPMNVIRALAAIGVKSIPKQFSEAVAKEDDEATIEIANAKDLRNALARFGIEESGIETVLFKIKKMRDNAKKEADIPSNANRMLNNIRKVKESGQTVKVIGKLEDL